MFRFSIRELMVVVMAAAMGVAWLVEHQHLQSALIDAKEAQRQVDDAQEEAESWKAVSSQLELTCKRTDDALARHGLIVMTMRMHGPAPDPELCKVNPDGTVSDFVSSR